LALAAAAISRGLRRICQAKPDNSHSAQPRRFVAPNPAVVLYLNGVSERALPRRRAALARTSR